MADTYEVVRTTTIAASPHDVYAHLVDFHRWQAWSPWEDLDPDQKRTYSGAESGVGAKYAWKGNRKVGEGSMAITKAEAPSNVTLDLHFLKPFKSTAQTRFDVVPNDAGSLVSWTLTGEKTLMTKVMGIFKSMDALMGPDFEKGLARLKKEVETEG